VFIYSTPGAAPGQLSINHHGWQATNTVLFSSAGSLVLMHVMDVNFMLRTRQFLNGIDGFLAGCTTSAEDLYFVFQSCTSPFLPSSVMEPPSAGMQAGQMATWTRRGHAFQREARTNRPTPVYVTGADSK
jgi:hypothetical protein